MLDSPGRQAKVAVDALAGYVVPAGIAVGWLLQAAAKTAQRLTKKRAPRRRRASMISPLFVMGIEQAWQERFSIRLLPSH
jgi:hypothetical protein